MADLTGDFDVIAQFAVPAVNRVLAAMHRVERFPHSMSLRVDDTPQPTHGWRPSVIGVRDVFGDATADPSNIRNPRPINIGDFPSSSANGRLAAALGAVANFDLIAVNLPPFEPSNIKGKAQVQVFPPTIELTDPSGKTVTVRMELIARYLPDPGTSPVAEYVRGELRVSAPINQVISQAGRTISVDVRAASTVINFSPTWSSVPIGPQDMAGINLLIRNALRTGFLPSSSDLGSAVGHIQFKAMTGGAGAVAILLDMNPDDAAGNPATATEWFLSGVDGFSVGIGADFMRASIQPALDDLLQQPIPDQSKWGYTYSFALEKVTLEFHNGKMLLVIKGHAHTETSYLPDFNFTVKQDITLRINGSTADLHFGTLTYSANKFLVTVASYFFSSGVDQIKASRDRAIQDTDLQNQVRFKLSAERNFGAMLKSLLTPAREANEFPPLDVVLRYTVSEIRETGIILHGSITVPPSPPPRVEYEPITSASTGGLTLPGDAVDTGTDYTALKSWIPGGTIDRYEWHSMGSPGYSDPNRFVLLHQGLPTASAAIGAPHAIAAYSPMCLTVHGRRLSTFGAVVTEPVTATICGYRSFPVDVAVADISPIFALARRGSGGMVDIVGHAAPTRRSPGATPPNFIIHFTDEVSGEKLSDLVTAFQESKRPDAPTAILVAAKSSRIERLPYSEIVTYVDDDGQLRKHYGVSAAGAMTIVVDPSGKVVWKGEGPINTRELTSALSKVLVKGAPPKPALLSATARIERRAPNFLFEAAPDQILTLRKVGGRKVVLVFFNPSSQPSVDAVRDATAGNDRNALVLAIGNDGVSSSREMSPAIVVPDTKGEIARAYGVTMWPTIFSIDEDGIVRSIGYGRLTKGEKSRA